MTEQFHLTYKDRATLESMRRSLGTENMAMLGLVERKLENSLALPTDAIGPDVATLNSRVSFCVDDGPPQIRIICQTSCGGNVGALLPIAEPRGIALLGLSVGQSLCYATDDGGAETVTLLEILHQPEAARRETLKHEQAGPVLRLVYSAPASKRQAPPYPAPDFDDHEPPPAA